MSPPPRRRVVTAPARKPPVQLLAVCAVVLPDEQPDTAYLEQEEFEDRLQAYKRGAFSYVGVRVEAEVRVAQTTQVLKSPGLWGIESDTEKDEIVAIVQEEWDALRAVLKEIGVPTEQLPLAADREWIKWSAR